MELQKIVVFLWTKNEGGITSIDLSNMIRTKTIEKIVREFIAKELTLSPESINLDDNLVEDLHADSMDIVNVVTAIESRFKISFPENVQVPYNGYTLRFLVEGTQRAIKEKSPVRRVAKKVAESKPVKEKKEKEKKEKEKKEKKDKKAPKPTKAKKEAKAEETAPSDNL